MSAQFPVAIVGIGCRLPGGSDTKELYYEFLRNKGDGMSEPPPDRWDHKEWGSRPDEPGKYNVAMCGFIKDIDQFDTREFGISMKEAQQLDPSSRLILEVAHLALLDSGIDYRGSNTGVYIGQLLISASELGNGDRYEVNSYQGLGKCISLRSNRVSFTFDLRGPSLMVDTACSSSATAMHMAMNAIKLGEIDQALIIGGNVIAQPVTNVMFSKTGILSPTGSSKSFDAAADGYARAEGFGAIMIKRLDKALTDGDTVYSVITGSAINSNGKGVSLTMPKASMQAETIRQAYAHANRKPSEAFFVELHATGTSVGDPIEANIVGQVFSEERESDRVLRIGSVKSNIGHTEGCSFLASLIKVSLMLKHKEIIPNIRFNNPNPKIDFKKWLMRVQTELEQITPEQAAADGKWIASVSSSGIGGSNSHMVLETLETVNTTTTLAITESQQTISNKPLYLFVIAALTGPSLVPWKDALTKFYQDTTDDRVLRSLTYDLARKSRSCPARSFAVAPALSPDLKFSKPAVINMDANPILCLVFSGQGPQHIAMGRELCAAYPVFLSAVKDCDEILVGTYGKESFLERTGLFVPGEQAKLPEKDVWPIEEVVYSIVFMQLALVDLIKSLGIEYTYTLGHSIGEIAMGYASGHYSKKTAVGIAAARATAMATVSGNGSMIALGACYHRAKYMIKHILADAQAEEGLWIAAINSPKDVTVAGDDKLIDMLVSLAQERGTFVVKLKVTCAFHTPLMDPCEQEFRKLVKLAFADGMGKPVVRTMSTVYAGWLQREMDEEYCWDNIRQPVLFGKPVDDIVKERGPEGVVFLEISPHPVLQAYINSCGGKAFSLVRRPNPKVPAKNTGEHQQLLEGIGSLLSAGFKGINFAKLCATPDGRQDFIQCELPEFPYNRSKCWSESAADRSMRLQSKRRPLASTMFRLNCDTHPDLAGHVIFERPIFPASGYVESILENGAMVVSDVKILRPLMLGARGSDPGHVGCINDGKEFEFRVATSNTYDNGYIKLDTIYATGAFLTSNPQFDPDEPIRFDVDSKLALSRCSITGEEFYQAIPTIYGYQDNFSSYIKEIHELPDDDSWGGSAYLIKLEIPENDDNGYVIHPSILDSIMHSTLAAFIDMDTKSFDFTENLLPVKIEQITRWDKGDNSDLDFDLQGTIWAYLTITTWAPSGPCRSNLIVANSESRVILTIDGMECAIAPQEQFDMEECFTTIWQPKLFPVAGFTLPSIEDLATPSYIRQVFDGLIDKATVAGRHVIRVLDLDTSSVVANAVGESLVAIPSNKLLVDYFLAGMTPEDADEKARALSYPRARPFVYDPTHANAGVSPEEADAKVRAMARPEPDPNSGLTPEDAEEIARAMARARQAELDPNSGEYAMVFTSFDILFQVIDASISASDVDTLLQYLAPCGVLVLLYKPTSADSEKPDSEKPDSEKPDAEKPDAEKPDAEKPDAEKPDAEKPDSETPDLEKPDSPDSEKPELEKSDPEKPEGEQALMLQAFQQIPKSDISVVNLDNGEALILVRSRPPCVVPAKEDAVPQVVIHHFTRGTEAELVEVVNQLPENSEIWILGDDNAIGIGALGIAACIIAESPNFVVRSLLFENRNMSLAAREEIVKTLRQIPSLLEQHLKYTRTGAIYVRRLVYHPTATQASLAPGVAIESPFEKGQISAYFPPTIKDTDVQISVEVFGIDSISADKPSVAFVGKVSHIGAEVKNISIASKVVGIAKHPITDIVVLDEKSITVLPSDVPDGDAVALPVIALVPWLALAEYAPISSSSVILLHDASTHVGFGAVQLCQRFGAKFFCTVATPADAKRLSDELNVDEQAIATSLFTNATTPALQTWLSENKLSGFDIVFNLLGSSMNATIFDLLTPTGQYIHNKSNTVDQVKIPSGAPMTRVIDVPKLVELCPSNIASSLGSLLTAHISTPFKLQSQSTSVSHLSGSTGPSVPKSEVLVATPDVPRPIHIKSGQLFNPRKSYILVGGSSELGVRISVWMATRGARHIILTSRRGPAALGKMDKVYLRHLQLMDVTMDVIAADARSGEDMTGVVVHANNTAPIGGVFLMTVVSHDGMFSGMKQESFDDVYFSKVIALHTFLKIVNPAALDFLLLFSTIGSVFGNAGQSAYCASQLYLDRIAESLPNTVSISLPPISDSGMFKRLLQSSKGRSSSKMAMKIGVTTAQACDFIADSIIRQISHYVPAIAMKHVPMVFSTCEPLLYNHILPTRFLVKQSDNERGTIETPASLLGELLGLSIDQIANDVTLKDYGLDSLGAIRYSKELAGHFGIKVGQLELLGAMNIGLLNDMVAASNKFGHPALEGPDDADAKYISAPQTNLMKQIAFGDAVTTNASRLQSRIWLSHLQTKKLNGSAGQCENHGLLMTISSPTDIDIVRMREAFAEVIQRHGALRTAFFLSQGRLEQCVYPFLDFEINVVDLKAEADAERKAYKMSLDICEELDLILEKLPLFRATVFNLGNDTWSISFISHQIVMDQASLGVIFHELLMLYHKGIESLEPQDMHFSDLSDWLFQTSDHRAETQAQQREFWNETLKDVQPTYLMPSTPSEQPLSDLTQMTATVDASTLELCHSLMKEAGATPSEGFFAVYNTLLCNLSSQETMVVGTAVTQRHTAQLANVIGPLTTLLPIKTTVDPNQTFQEYLTGLKTDLSKGVENSDVIYEEINPEILDPSARPRYFRHSFAYNGMNLDAISELEMEGMQVQHFRPLSTIKDEPQELHLDVYGKTGRVILQFNNHIFSEEDARKILDTYIAFVEAVCRSPDSKICDLDSVFKPSEPTPVTALETDSLLAVTNVI
ncbi:hypothetical protein BYT27DRAFT_6834852 [Phlegmacium glaucopus]|nr:hypothetical protein BYT27DRAFT_6834852 [Phlegmacium glaucopus]